MKWRIIDTNLADPYYVTAADEVLLQSNSDEKNLNTLHFYIRKPPGVSLGRSRKIKNDVNISVCQQYGIKIVRRLSGGGTIFTDEGCLVYSLIFHDFHKNKRFICSMLLYEMLVFLAAIYNFFLETQNVGRKTKRKIKRIPLV